MLRKFSIVPNSFFVPVRYYSSEFGSLHFFLNWLGLVFSVVSKKSDVVFLRVSLSFVNKGARLS